MLGGALPKMEDPQSQSNLHIISGSTAMATLESLTNLFEMGFILEEEYLARRAEFGVPASEPATNTEVSPPIAQDTSSYYNQTPTYDSYNTSYSYNPPEPVVDTTSTTFDSYHSYSTPVDNTTSYTPYDSGYSSSYAQEDPYAQTNIASVTISPPHESTDSITSSGGYNFASESTNSTSSYNPEPINTEATTQSKVSETGESYSHVFTTPTTDDSPYAALGRPIPYGKSLLVHRTRGAYLVKEIDPSNSILETLTSCKIDSAVEIYKCGTAEVIVSPEMYWQSTTHKAAPSVTSIEAGNIYCTRETTTQLVSSTPVFDERVIWRYQYGRLEKDSIFSGSSFDIYTPPARIPGLRLMSDAGYAGYYDPREVVKHYAKYVKKEEPMYYDGHVKTNFKLQTRPTPAFLQWPLLIHLLRSTQAKVDDKYCRSLPEDSQGICDRVKDCIEKGVCYFTGEPAVPGYFLSPNLHNDSYAELINSITSSGSFPQGGKTAKHPPIIGVASYEPKKPYTSSSNLAVRDAENDDGFGERIKYTDPTMKMSYGWPTTRDLSGTSTATGLDYIKPVSAVRGTVVTGLVQTLSSLSGPAPDVDTKVTV